MKLGTLGRTPHLPSRVAAQIVEEITEGRLKPGDRLPTEQALAESFGVSRNVVREAISRLRSDGMIQSRQGVGAFIVRSEANSTLRIDPETLTDRSAFLGLFELRAILEIRAAGIAAQLCGPAQLAALADALGRMRGAEKWEKGGVDADLEFHRLVARATGNPYLAMVIGFLSEQVRESIMETRARAGPVGALIDVTIAEHQAIYDALAEGAPHAARKAMSTHINNAAARLGYTLSIDETS